jgi:hypothetical protein
VDDYNTALSRDVARTIVLMGLAILERSSIINGLSSRQKSNEEVFFKNVVR